MLQHLNSKEVTVENLASSLRKSHEISENITETVQKLIEDVKTKGNKAVFDLTLKFDKVDLTKFGLKVTKDEIKQAYEKVSEIQIQALKKTKQRIEDFESKLLKNSELQFSPVKGLTINSTFRPLESVGCYVPGGVASYPSSLLMSVVPAKVAGVKKISVCSPALPNGDLNPLLLVGADICEVDEFYRIGGVQAIASLALGTETINPVAKIVGPGNIYVTCAKIIVSHFVDIDLPAGPSEILIYADNNANPRKIALDLIAQSEHSKHSICGVVTTSKELFNNIEKEINKLIDIAPRKEIIEHSLKTHGFYLTVNSEDEAIRFVNAFAPEHLEVFTSEPEQAVKKVSSAGLILLGDTTPVAASDYSMGTNHILPTGGYAKTRSGLSVFDFCKRVNIVSCNKEGLQSLAEDTISLAEAEGLYSHAQAVKERV